jgi:hypothetical protein
MLLIKFPSKSRPEKLVQVYKKYIEYATNPSQIKSIISLDNDDQTVTPELVQSLKNIHPATDVVIGEPAGKIGAVNRDMEFSGDWDILVLVSDDMIPEVRGWDSIIRMNMRLLYPDTDGVLWFNDGFQKNNLNTLCILGHTYYNRFGYIYHPAYKSLWCDNEFMIVADMLGKQTYFEDIIIRHTHPVINNSGFDELYNHNDSFFEEDRRTFIARKMNSFK